MRKKIFILLGIFWSFPVVAQLYYRPQGFDERTANLLVVVHGCLQSAEAMSLGTGWNQVADKNNWVVLYPQVPEGHPLGCWSWYLPENQQPSSGELTLIFKQITKLRQDLELSQAKVFLSGISSGAATVAGLLACYPEAFAAAHLHSGPSYGLAQDAKTAEAVLRQGPPLLRPANLPCEPKAYSGGVLVVHGSADTTVNVKHMEQMVADFASLAKPSSPKVLFANGLSFTQTDFFVLDQLRARTILVSGLGHAWSGFNLNLRHREWLGPGGLFSTQLPFFSNEGPSATDLAAEFFNKNR